METTKNASTSSLGPDADLNHYILALWKSQANHPEALIGILNLLGWFRIRDSPFTVHGEAL